MTMIKITLGKEECVSPARFSSIRYRIELEGYAEDNNLQQKVRELQNMANEHIEQQKLRDKRGDNNGMRHTLPDSANADHAGGR